MNRRRPVNPIVICFGEEEFLIEYPVSRGIVHIGLHTPMVAFIHSYLAEGRKLVKDTPLGKEQ